MAHGTVPLNHCAHLVCWHAPPAAPILPPPQTKKVQPYVVHMTWTYNGIPGKRSRLRDMGLWVDPPPYYANGSYVTVDLQLPEVRPGRRGSEPRAADGRAVHMRSAAPLAVALRSSGSCRGRRGAALRACVLQTAECKQQRGLDASWRSGLRSAGFVAVGRACLGAAPPRTTRM